MSVPVAKRMEYIEFFQNNIVVISLIAFGILGYLLVLIRRRKRLKYLHRQKKNEPVNNP